VDGHEVVDRDWPPSPSLRGESSPVLQTSFADAAEDGIDIDLRNQDSVVLWLNWSIGGGEIERYSVVEFYHFERAEPD
jgi:hypothetical protein